MTVDQGPLLTVPEAGPAAGPYARRCGVAGPYYWPNYSPAGVCRLQILVCTRPTHAEGSNHQHARADTGVLAEWTGDGRPVWPSINAKG